MTKHEILEMLKGENKDVQDLVIRYGGRPIQSFKRRYELVKLSQKEGNFEIFKRIAEIFGRTYVFLADSESYEDECKHKMYGSYGYDFELVLNLARWYQNNPNLFEGQFDIIEKVSKKQIDSDKYYCRRDAYMQWKSMESLVELILN